MLSIDQFGIILDFQQLSQKFVKIRIVLNIWELRPCRVVNADEDDANGFAVRTLIHRSDTVNRDYVSVTHNFYSAEFYALSGLGAEWWHYLVGALLGLVLLGALIAALWKMNCFSKVLKDLFNEFIFNNLSFSKMRFFKKQQEDEENLDKRKTAERMQSRRGNDDQ
jgi:hypothetical protein